MALKLKKKKLHISVSCTKEVKSTFRKIDCMYATFHFMCAHNFEKEIACPCVCACTVNFSKIMTGQICLQVKFKNYKIYTCSCLLIIGA